MPWDRTPTRRAGRSRFVWPILASFTSRFAFSITPPTGPCSITSGEFGDKLPIGFRGCHAGAGPGRVRLPAPRGHATCASWPHCPTPWRRECSARRARACRFFAPAMRNVLDRDCPVSSFARSIDILSCNRQRVGNARRPRRSRLASFDLDRDRRARRQRGPLHDNRRRGTACLQFRFFPAGGRRAIPTGPANRTRRPCSQPCSTTAGTPRRALSTTP